MSDISMDLYLAYEDGYKKGKAETEAYLLHCGDVTPVTNADHIRAMTDEELAEWFLVIQDDIASFYDKGCSVAPELPTFGESWLEWLKQEVDDG